MRTILIWGAGRIGRGFVADIFSESPDFEIVFADIDRELVDKLNRNGSYTIAKATRDGITERKMTGFRAVHTSDEDALRELFDREDLLLDIAVHEPKVKEVAGMLAPYLTRRAESGKPMDVMMNVNMARPDVYFIDCMKERLSGKALEYFENRVGVTGIFAMCISPLAPDWLKQKDELALWNNGYHEQAISEPVLKCPVPRVPRLRLTKDIEREETRKLYTLNMAHGLLCYLGLPLGLSTSAQAVNDPRLRPVLEKALEESCTGLIHTFGFGREEMDAWKQTILRLLENPYIEDGLQRLGADTRRKLGPADRLAGPARLCVRAGGKPENLLRALKAGFDYENPDEGTRAVRAFCRANGLKASLEKFSGIAEGDELYPFV